MKLIKLFYLVKHIRMEFSSNIMKALTKAVPGKGTTASRPATPAKESVEKRYDRPGKISSVNTS